MTDTDRTELKEEWLSSLLGQFVGDKNVLAVRKLILNDPRRILTNELKSPIGYCIASLFTPFVIAFLIMGSLEAAGVIPKSRIDQEIAEIEKDIAEVSSVFGTAFPSAITDQLAQRQARLLNDSKQEIMAGFESLKQQFQQAKRLSERQQQITITLSQTTFFLNAIVFAFLFNRAFRQHLTPTKSDIELTRKSYLYVIGTTGFVPSIVSAISYMVAGTFERYDPIFLVAYAPTATFLTFLPAFAMTIVGASRLRTLLRQESDWRIAKTVTIMALSNWACFLFLSAMLGISLLLFRTDG